MKKLIILGIILLFISIIPISTADSYHEDVNVLIIGRCATVYHFTGMYVGRLKYAGVTAYSPFPIEDKIHILTSQGNYLNVNMHTVFMHNVTGVFLWMQKGNGWRVLPFSPMVFIMCRAEKMWITNL